MKNEEIEKQEVEAKKPRKKKAQTQTEAMADIRSDSIAESKVRAEKIITQPFVHGFEEVEAEDNSFQQSPPHPTQAASQINTPPYYSHFQPQPAPPVMRTTQEGGGSRSVPAVGGQASASTAAPALKFSDIRQLVASKFNTKGKGGKIIAFSLSMILCLVALIALASPIIRGGMGLASSIRITPFNLIFTPSGFSAEQLFSPLFIPDLSYWVARAFYTIFAVALLIIVIANIFVLVNKKRDDIGTFTDISMSVILVLLFISVLISTNFRNIYGITASHHNVRSGGTGAFVIGLILLIIKLALNIVFKQAKNEEFEKSRLSIATAFVLFVLVISILFTPVYIFGPMYRLNGIGILLGRNDILRYMPSSSAYRVIIVLFLIVCFFSFIINLLLYVGNKKIFVQFNKFNNILGVSALVVYFIIGANYAMLVSDLPFLLPPTFNPVFMVFWYTFAYIPLALFGMYVLGLLFVKLTANRQNIEYKVYAKGGERKRGGGLGGDKDKQKEEPEITGYDPIPAFSEIDGLADMFEAAYQSNLAYKFEGITLPSLVDHIIDYAKYSPQNLSYGRKEIRTFIAGLGASRLSILQGMSGTGKTSLPKIFAEAIGGICEMIAVESSWRDKNELLGYYNEFNKKFTPKAFTQALYKASLNKDTPVFIVLDEMNLSRIEYYFSDFLSLMEAEESQRRIKLFDVQLYPETDEREEYLSLGGGHTLDVSNNIWFVGTANRDESTFEISDKVYDRAQTMNFDKRAPKAATNGAVEYPKKFVTMQQLRAMFDECKSIVFDAESNDTIKKVEKLLLPYRISFGNRVLRQIEEFVRVYVAACGAKNNSERDGYIHEAIDCIVYSKIVRKLEFKQINNLDELIDAFSDLKLPSCEQFLLGLQN